jgi:phosphoribosylformylglycinamidine synthase
VGIGEASLLIDAPLSELRDAWEATSFELEKLQCAVDCVAQEQASLANRQPPAWKLTYEPVVTPLKLLKSPSGMKEVAVIRQEGSNGDREMAAAVHAAGLAAWDVAMSDLVGGAITLDRFRGVIFVGGFSYADVLGSAKGWAAVLKFNSPLWAQLQAFRARTDTFSLGVCNGCQLMALLGWVPGAETAASAPEQLPQLEQPRFIHNASGRFESRFSSVTIGPSPAVLLEGMEGSSLGVWVAHGEGRAHFPQPDVLQTVLKKNLAPIRYVDDANQVTDKYPFNPNGSPHGIAALCSEDGRHLAMMPHPERCFQTWQWPWMPNEWDGLKAGPWLRLFQNAQRFCEK